MTKTEAVDTTIVVSAQVDVATREQLMRRAREGDRSLSAEIRRALVRHLAERNEQEKDT